MSATTSNATARHRRISQRFSSKPQAGTGRRVALEEYWPPVESPSFTHRHHDYSSSPTSFFENFTRYYTRSVCHNNVDAYYVCFLYCCPNLTIGWMTVILNKVTFVYNNRLQTNRVYCVLSIPQSECQLPLTFYQEFISY